MIKSNHNPLKLDSLITQMGVLFLELPKIVKCKNQATTVAVAYGYLKKKLQRSHFFFTFSNFTEEKI